MCRAGLTLLALQLSRCLASSFKGLAAGATPGSDLHVFVSRPEIRVPKLEITYSDPDFVAPGYFFVAPYYDLSPIQISAEFIPFQVGPCIYDSNGDLVWTGAEIVENRNAFDFRIQELDGAPALTFILADAHGQNGLDPKPAGLVLDSSYQIIRNITLEATRYRWDLHEFHIVDNSSITTMESITEVDLLPLHLRAKKGKVWQYGFREADINTKVVTREWYPLEAGITIEEPLIDPPKEWKLSPKTWSGVWDCFHTNSVDRDANGDYLLSMRYTSTIYKVSGKDGSILWRLGGKNSDFDQDFTFSSQHYAMFHDDRDGLTIISMLDNASDEANRQPNTSETSSIKVIAIDENATPKTAKLLQEMKRPDGKLTKMRGSAQSLPNKNWFAGWSDEGYVNEFTSDGRNVLEARFTSSRFDSYRAYKFEFVGNPKEPPVLKTFAHSSNATNPEIMSTVFYVSWNGATEVKSWEFFVTNDPSKPGTSVGSISKSGFETSFVSNHFWAYAYVEGRDGAGSVLGKSDIVTTVLPNHLEKNYTVEGLAAHAGTGHINMDTGPLDSYMIVELPSSRRSKFLYVALAVVNTVLSGLGIFTTGRFVLSRCRGMKSKKRVSEEFAMQEEAMLKHYRRRKDSSDDTDETYIGEGEDDDLTPMRKIT